MGQSLSDLSSTLGSLGGMSEDLIPLESEERLSPIVYRILGFNPGEFELQGTNTYLVGKGPNVALVDCGEKGNARYQRSLTNTLDREGLSVEKVLVTHWHRDHLGGAADLFSKVWRCSFC